MYLLDHERDLRAEEGWDGKADAAVVTWVSGVDAGEMFISALTLMELEIGILRVERAGCCARRAAAVHGLKPRSCPEFEERTLSIDGAIARRCARLHVPDPKSERDALIAATALETWTDGCYPQHGRLRSNRCFFDQSLG